MQPILAACRGFSCPQEGVDEDVMSHLAAEYGRQYVGRFIERHRAGLDRCGPGLSAFLGGWLAPHKDFDDFWDPAIADARSEVLRTTPSRVSRVAAALACRLSASGEPGEWSVALRSPVRLRWGRWVLPPADRIRVKSDGRRAVVQTRCNGVLVDNIFLRSGRDWATKGARPLPAVTARKHRVIMLLGNAVETLHVAGDVPRPSRQTAKAIVRASGNALALIRRHAPVYLPWVDRVIRGVIPVHSTLSTIRSGSDFNRPGVIHLSFPARTFALAEMFVHEASHQYFQIAYRLSDLHDGSDRTLYYSPVRRTGRPIDKILLAYHAFANVLLFYRAYGAEGRAHLASCRHNEAELLPQLEQLETALRKSPALTPAGRALWQPLARRIH